MKVKELIEELKKFEPEADVLVSSDEELNTLYKGIEVATFVEKEGDDDKEIVIYGLSGQEREQEI